MENVAYAMSWTEIESGWGQRPDGISLHGTLDDYKSAQERIERSNRDANGRMRPEITVPDWPQPQAVACDPKIAALARAGGTLWLPRQARVSQGKLELPDGCAGEQFWADAEKAWLAEQTPQAANPKKHGL